MTIEKFLKNLEINNDYYQKFDLVTKERYRDLEVSFKSKKELTDFSKEFGFYTNCSVILIDKYTDTQKSFLAIKKTSNYLYRWTELPNQSWKSKVKVNPAETIMFIYNEFGKPTEAITASTIIREVGLNSYSKDNRLGLDTEKKPYRQDLTLQDLNNLYAGYFQYLEVFESKPFAAPELENINFILYGNSKTLDKDQLLRWAFMNGIKSIKNKPDKDKQNVLVCLSEFPTTTKSIFEKQIPVDHRYKNYPRLSLKDFINIPYNVYYKKDFKPRLSLIKAARYNNVNDFKTWVKEYETTLLSKKAKEKLVEELDKILYSLEE